MKLGRAGPEAEESNRARLPGSRKCPVFFLLVIFLASFLIHGEGDKDDQTSGELTCLTDSPGTRANPENDVYISC